MENKTHLLVILQSHSESNALKQRETAYRYAEAPKVEVSKRAILSLIHSINYAKCRDSNLEVELKIIDDHSCGEFLNDLNQIINFAQFPVTMMHTAERGIMQSIATCYKVAKEHVKEYVYFIQDDYIHSEHAIHYMLKNYKHISHRVNNDIVLSGWHNTQYLLPDTIRMGCMVVPGIEGYWRSTAGSQFVMMVTANLFLKNFDLFENFGNEEYHDNCENNTINWLHANRGYLSFCPIISLVIQIQWEVHKDPYLDWESWWKKYDLKNFFSDQFRLPTDDFYEQRIS